MLDSVEKIKVYKCGACGKETTFIMGVCESCDEQGVWLDPAGGVHYGGDDPDVYDDYDPASMYE